MILKPELPPKAGYVEVEVDGVRVYRNAVTGVLMRDEKSVPEEPAAEPSVWDELDAAYKAGYAEGVNSYDE